MDSSAPKPTDPLEFKTEPWRKHPTQAFTTTPVIKSLSPNSDRTAGGTAITITGLRFRSASDGTKPTVLFGSTPAVVTSVSADGTTIICTAPSASAAGYVDVTVTNPSPLESAVLTGSFLYYAGEIVEVTPSYATTSGAVQVTVRGASLSAGSTFTFGGTPATGVIFIDDTQYVMTVPAHVAGYGDVVMTEVGGHQSTIRHGFQFTTLARGTDIRRYPGTRVSKSLGSQPWTSNFCLDGSTNKPVAGEEVQVTDPFDSGRVLYHGIIQQADQKYEGQIDQLVWECQAGDFQYFMNKYRPFGSYISVSASEVVRDLMTKYAPSFDIAFVQTKLALVSLTFDGTKTMSEALDMVARAIGGGRWYLDGRALHFFNPPAPTTIVIPAGSTGTGADFTAAVLSLGSKFGSTATYDSAYYAVRVTFLYSNGTESRLGPTSNVVASDGASYLHVASLPIGNNPGGGITCVGRRIYFLKGSNALASAIEIDDNVTTSVDFAPMANFSPSVGTSRFGSPVTVSDSGTNGASQQTSVDSLVFGSGQFYYSGGIVYVLGGTPKYNYVSSASDLGGGFVIKLVADDPNYLTSRSYAYWVQFAITAVYPDGAQTALSEWRGGNQIGFYEGRASFFANISGYPTQAPQYTSFYTDYNGLSSSPLVNGKKPVAFNLYMRIVGYRTALANGASQDTVDVRPAQWVGSCPFFDGSNGTAPTRSGVALDSTVNVTQTPGDLGIQPQQVPNATDPTYIWPNPDGPYLEDYSTPHEINDTDGDLLHADSGSQPFVSNEDITQLRNRVKAYGASSVTVEDAAVGAVAIGIANPNVFPVGGGTVLAANGVELSFFSVSSQISTTKTPARLLLTKPLTRAIPNGTVVSFFCMAEDKDAQKKRGLIELDALGNPTDGVHEYVVRDESLTSMQAVYLRAHAELSIYKDPIVTVRYATRDPLTRPGARVSVNLTDPPCKGTFLIQTVDVDQIRDEGDQLAPRYTVVATNVLYDLTNFLLMLTSNSQLSGAGTQSPQSAGSSASVGVVGSAILQAAGGSVLDLSTIRGSMSYSALGSTTGSSFTALIGPASSLSGKTSTAGLIDSRGAWVRLTSTGTGGNANNASNSSFSMRADHNPQARGLFRTGALVTAQRMWLGLAVSNAPIYPNGETPLTKGFGVRYSTVALDAGFTLYTFNGTTLTLGPVISAVGMTPNTEYDYALVVSEAGNTMTFTINGVSAAMTIPGACRGVDLLFAHFQYNQAAGDTVMDYLRIYLQHGMLI